MADLKKTPTDALAGGITQDGPMVHYSDLMQNIAASTKKQMQEYIPQRAKMLEELQEIDRKLEVMDLVEGAPLMLTNTEEGTCVGGEARFTTPDLKLLLFVGTEEFEKGLQVHDYTKMNLTDAQARALDGHDVVIAYGKNDKAKLYDLGATQGKSWDERTNAMVEKAKSLGKDGICR